jgi:2-methylcitrate dehydratase PrpD
VSSLSLAQRLAIFGSELKLDAVPESVRATAKRCIIDTVGVTFAAAKHPLSKRVQSYVCEVYASGEATILGSSKRISPVGAALVNGTAGHVLDFDDTSYTGIMHGSAVIFPAALAATEMGAGDGRRLLESFIAGCEVTYAVALLCTTEHYYDGWWSTATCGVFGATVASAKAMDLSLEQTVSALGIAGAQACGPKVIFGTDAKPYLAGRAAAIGVEAAYLAASGVIGPPGVFENSVGFLHLFNKGRAELGAIDKLGEVWRLTAPGIFFKQFPVCSAAHAATELTQKLLHDNKVGGNAVRKVICDVPPTVAVSLVHERPSNLQEAQFSLPFAVGSILTRGTLDIDSLADDVLTDQNLVKAMLKVEMHRVDELHDEGAPECARITVQMHDGSEISGYLREPLGMPGNPMSNEQFRKKYFDCVSRGGLEELEAALLLNTLENIEQASKVF